MVTTSIGACNGQGECFVPIENDPAEGWSLSGNTVTLAAGLCGQLAGAPAAKGAASGTAQLFFANDANNPSCATKTEAQPVCGEAQLLGDGGGEDASSPGDGGAIAMGTGAPDANTSGGAFDSGKGSSGGGPNGPADAGQSAPVDASVVASGVLSGVTSLAAGPSTTCAVIQNNDVDCWGLVLGTETATPEPIAGLAGVSTGALGGSPTNGFACALQGAGGGPVSCEGANGTGQLGDESIMDSDSPMAVSGLTTATAIAAGTGFACAIVKSGDVECWGDDTYGQLGNETMGQTFTSPVAVQGLPMATAIALGSDFACALVQGGFVECWGDNANEIFGSSEAGAPASSSTPVTVEGFQVGDTISTIAAGLSHVCALMESGAVYCWGDNSFEQLGQSNSSLSVSATPIAVVPAGVTAIAAGGNATCVIMQGGEVECWGSNLDGQLGNASVGQFSAAPVTPGVSGAKSLVVGGEHACALLTDGTVECWGSNAYGQIGTGSYNFAIETASPVTAAGTGLAAASDAATPAP
jgi:alpha-tubulin suppressor-like RCC1 family protein